MRKIALLGLVLLALYHILILGGVVSSDFVWGGHINSLFMKIILESIALFIIFAMFYIIYNIKSKRELLLIKVGLIVGFLIFIFSLIGNLLSENLIEKIIGSGIALFYTVYFLMEIKNKNLKKGK